MNPAGSASKNSSDAIDSLIDWISSLTGLTFQNQRESATETVQRFVDQTFAGDVTECRHRLKNNKAAFDDLVGELTIGETYFFRDERQFDLIAGEFLNVMQAIRPTEHRLRFWSAACASGEEAWSLAAVLTLAGLGKSAHVLGTDISRISLSKAREGNYGSWSLRGSAGERMRPWGHQNGRRFDVSDRLRSLVSFEYLNLAADHYPSFSTKTNGLDLILCRNVLIYFDKTTIRTVAERLFQCLAPGGWLMTGASDPVLTEYAPFEVLMRDCGYVYVRPQLGAGSESADAGTRNRFARQERAAAASTLQRPEPPRSAPTESTSHRRTDVSQNRPDSAPLDRTSEPRYQPQRGEPQDSESEAAQKALKQGDYDRVLELTRDRLDDPACCVMQVRALASLNTEQAAACCAAVVQRHRVSPELNYLHAVLLAELDRNTEAATAARSAVFLDQKLIVGHLALGNAQERLGKISAARRSFRNALKLAESWPANQPVPCSDGESADRLAESASRHLALLGDE